MTHFSITVEIPEPIDRVWTILADIERWPEWTPTVTGIQRLEQGPMAVGSRFRISQPRLPPTTWQVSELQPGHRFIWITRRPGVCIAGKHRVEPTLQGTRVVLSLQYSGLIGGLVARLTRGLNQRYLALEAKGLHQRCTASAGTQRHAPLPG